jgi:putative flippase GtrA
LEYINVQKIRLFLNNHFLKYCITGVFNTVHHFLWFWLLSSLIDDKFANAIAFLIANVASFFINSFYTFRVFPSFKKFIKYPSVMAVQIGISYLVPLVCLAAIPQLKLAVPILTSIVNFPVGFLLTKKILNTYV